MFKVKVCFISPKVVMNQTQNIFLYVCNYADNIKNEHVSGIIIYLIKNKLLIKNTLYFIFKRFYIMTNISFCLLGIMTEQKVTEQRKIYGICSLYWNEVLSIYCWIHF